MVGGNLGLFEGNGGDLRIGLSLQSLHDGDQWRHEPLRLNVFIAAPRAAIEGILARQETVRQLVDNDWLYLFQVEEDGSVHRYQSGDWDAMAPSSRCPTLTSSNAPSLSV